MRLKTSKTLALFVVISILLLIVHQKVNQQKTEFQRVEVSKEKLTSTSIINNKHFTGKKTFDGSKMDFFGTLHFSRTGVLTTKTDSFARSSSSNTSTSKRVNVIII